MRPPILVPILAKRQAGAALLHFELLQLISMRFARDLAGLSNLMVLQPLLQWDAMHATVDLSKILT